MEDRYNNLKYHLNSASKMDSVPAKDFLTQLTKEEAPLGVSAGETAPIDENEEN